MAEIATYICTNRLCMLTLRISRDFPIWRADTPKELRALTVKPAAEKYVTGYRSESFCRQCKKVVDHTDSFTCSTCDTAVLKEHLATPCPQCTIGTLSMPEISIY